MKKFYSFFILLSVTTFSAAQLTMTSSFNPVVGDVMTIIVADTNINPFPTGANYTWNFSTLSITSNTSASNTVAPSSTPYASSYPNSNIATKDANNNYGYFLVNSSKYDLLGAVNSGGVEIIYSDPNTIFTYPFTYNSVVNDYLAATFFSGVSFYRAGNSTTTGDGYGTLILPSGTYNNVLRVKLTQDYSDSSSFGNYIYHIEVYYWFSAISKFPLMQVTIMDISGLVNNYSKGVSVNSIVSGTNESGILSSSLKLYPNPSTGKSNVSFEVLKPSSPIRISLFNLTGQEVREFTDQKIDVGIYEEPLDFEGIPSGMYILCVNSGNSFSRIKVSVK